MCWQIWYWKQGEREWISAVEPVNGMTKKFVAMEIANSEQISEVNTKRAKNGKVLGMNKRKAKKAENKAFMLQGMTYKEHKKYDRDYMQYLAHYNHSHKEFKKFDEDERCMIELGIMSPVEIVSRYGYKKTNNRWRQRRKYNSNIIA